MREPLEIIASVCIASYNHEDFIGSCIESILKQDFGNFELIIVDDASVDNTLQVAGSYKDRRIKIYKNDLNMGLSFSLNKAVNRASGNFVCISGSDDVFHPERLQAQVKYLQENHDTPIVFSDVEFIDASGKIIHNTLNRADQPLAAQSRNQWLAEFVRGKNRLFAPTAMFIKDTFEKAGGFDPRLIQTQDLDLWSRIAIDHDIGIIDKKLMYYRVHGNNLSTGESFSDEKRTRLHFELSKIPNQLVKIEDKCRIFEIFSASKPETQIELTAKEWLAILSSESEMPYLKNFGIALLFDILGQPEAAERMNASGFGYSFLYKKAGSAGVYCDNPDKWLLQQAANWEAAYKDLRDAYEATEEAKDYWHDQARRWEAEAKVRHK